MKKLILSQLNRSSRFEKFNRIRLSLNDNNQRSFFLVKKDGMVLVCILTLKLLSLVCVLRKHTALLRELSSYYKGTRTSIDLKKTSKSLSIHI